MFTPTQFRAHIAAQFVCTHNFKREFTPNEMAEVMARADQLIAAAGCVSCDGTGKFDTGMEPATRLQRPEDLVVCDHGQQLRATNSELAPAVKSDPWGDASATPTVAANTTFVQVPPPILDGANTTKPVVAATAEIKISSPVLETPTAKAASTDLMSGLENALHVNCKACNDTGKSSKGKPCVCQQHKVQNEMPKVETAVPDLSAKAAMLKATEKAEEDHKQFTKTVAQILTQKYETDQYLCEGCSNSNLTVTLVPEKTPQTAAYSCKDCSTVGEIAFDTPEDLTEFISLSKKVAQEVTLTPAVTKTRKKKDDKPGQSVPPTNATIQRDNPIQTNTLPSDKPESTASTLTQPTIPQFNFPKAPPIPPAAAPVIAAAQLAEQNITGSVEVDITELPAVDVDAAKIALAGTFDSMEPAKIIKEWEILTSKVFDAKTQTIDMLKADLTDQLLGVYTGK